MSRELVRLKCFHLPIEALDNYKNILYFILYSDLIQKIVFTHRIKLGVPDEVQCIVVDVLVCHIYLFENPNDLCMCVCVYVCVLFDGDIS